MSVYKIPVIYEVVEYMEIEADNIEKAIIEAQNKELSPTNSHYLEDSFQIDSVGIIENNKLTTEEISVLEKLERLVP